MNDGPKILLLDIETAPILAHVWDIWDQNVGLNQIVKDWHLLSWCAKWLGEKAIIYKDQSKAKVIEDDKALCLAMWKLLNEADIIITQNGKKFDAKKLNARFVIHNMKPPSPYKHVDTRLIARKHFGFTSNSLEYMSDRLNLKHKKHKHKKFPGHELWVQCLKRNPEAWKEMEKYNRNDVLALEDLYNRLEPWDNTVNPSVYREGMTNTCQCGSTMFVKNGFCYMTKGKYQRWSCRRCGGHLRSSENQLDSIKRAVLRVKCA